jgi:hypothetical protein
MSDQIKELRELLHRYVQQDLNAGNTDNNLFRSASAALSHPAQPAPAQPQGVVSGAALECLKDVVSHCNDFIKACTIAGEHASSYADQLYWKHQIDTYSRMAVQASEAINAQPQGAVTEEMRSAVRWAPSSAYWSKVLVEHFGPDARIGIDALERQLRDALAAQPQGDGEAAAWAAGYRAGIEDERTSEANLGIAGFGMKVEPNRQNPYATPPASQASNPLA